MLRKVLKTIGTLLVLVVSWQLWAILDKPIDTFVVEGDMTPAERERIQNALSDVGVEVCRCLT